MTDAPREPGVPGEIDRREDRIRAAGVAGEPPVRPPGPGEQTSTSFTVTTNLRFRVGRVGRDGEEVTALDLDTSALKRLLRPFAAAALGLVILIVLMVVLVMSR